MSCTSDTINVMLEIQLDHFKTADEHEVLKNGTERICCYEASKRHGDYTFRASVYPNGTLRMGRGYVVVDVKEILSSTLSFPSKYYDILKCTVSVVDVSGIKRFPRSFEKIIYRESLLFQNFQPPKLCNMKFIKRSLLFEQADELLPGDVLTLLFNISYLSKAGFDHRDLNLQEMNSFENYVESFDFKEHQSSSLVESNELTSYDGHSAEINRDSSCANHFNTYTSSDGSFPSDIKNETGNSVVILQYQNNSKVSPLINQTKNANEKSLRNYHEHDCLTQPISMNLKKVVRAKKKVCDTAGTRSSDEVHQYGFCSNFLERPIKDTNELKHKLRRKETVLAAHEWIIQTNPKKVVVSFEEGKDTYGSKLLAASPVFRCLVNIPMKEKLEKFIDLSHVESQSFGNLLHYLKHGNIYYDTYNDVTDLYKIAHMYDIKDLLPVCAFYLAKSMNSITNVLVKELADFYSDEILIGHVESYNKSIILNTPLLGFALDEDETNYGNDRPDMNCYI